jgi:ABC-type multidrug transport system ATPase subunit
LTKVYRNDAFEVRALDGVDIDLYEGEIVVFLGESTKWEVNAPQ